MRLKFRHISRSDDSHQPTIKQSIKLNKTFPISSLKLRSRDNNKQHPHHDLSSRMLKRTSKSNRMHPSMISPDLQSHDKTATLTENRVL
jgi:hypothetical protein